MPEISLYIQPRIAELLAAHKPAGMDDTEFAEYLLGLGLRALERELHARPGLVPDPQNAEQSS